MLDHVQLDRVKLMIKMTNNEHPDKLFERMFAVKKDYGRGGRGGGGRGGVRGGRGGRSGGRGGKFKGKCHKCDKWGHKASECKPPGDGASTSGDSINTKETAGVALGG